jgi:hypothetical protein
MLSWIGGDPKPKAFSRNAGRAMVGMPCLALDMDAAIGSSPIPGVLNGATTAMHM